MTNKFDSSKVFFTSDVHFDHNNIIRFCDRPYNNLHEMNEELTKNWNETVPEDGIVFILGDFCFGNKHMWRKRIDRLNGTKYLILGNHDHLKDIPNECFESIDRMMNIEVIDGDKTIEMILCHYPLLTWAKIRYGTLQLFGHIHSNPNKQSLFYYIRSKNQYDVGVDNNDYRPISYSTLIERVEKQNEENKDNVKSTWASLL